MLNVLAPCCLLQTFSSRSSADLSRCQPASGLVGRGTSSICYMGQVMFPFAFTELRDEICSV